MLVQEVQGRLTEKGSVETGVAVTEYITKTLKRGRRWRSQTKELKENQTRDFEIKNKDMC
jgi:hypothetical protein